MTALTALAPESVGKGVDSLGKAVCLIGGDYENSNLGIRALTTGAITALRGASPGIDIAMLEYGRTPQRHRFGPAGDSIDVEVLNVRFSKNVLLRNHIARLIITAMVLRAAPAQLKQRLLSANPLLGRLAAFDVFLAINYGDSFSDIYGLRRFVYVILPQLLIILLGRPLVQLPQTIGPFKWYVPRAVATWILSRSRIVYVRDHDRVEYIRDLVGPGHRNRVRFCHDMAFLVPSQPNQAVEPPALGVIGFNVSGLLMMGGYTRNNMFRLKADYRSVIRTCLYALLEHTQATIRLVPHLLCPTGAEGDGQACSEFEAEFSPKYPGRIVSYARVEYTETEVKAVIAQCDLFVGARMHACIGALSQGVPVVGMAYSDKFAGVFGSVGMSETVADLRSMSESEVVEVVLRCYRDRERLAKELTGTVPGVKADVMRNLGNVLADRGSA